MEAEQFIQWLKELFVPIIKRIGGQHVLIVDGHSSHISLTAIEIYIQNNITMVCLPSQSSHILQYLEVGVYGHVKKELRLILQDYYFNSRAEKLDKENFAPLLKQLYSSNKAFATLHAVGGFQNTGLYPLNKAAIDRSKLTIVETFLPPTTPQQATQQQATQQQATPQLIQTTATTSSPALYLEMARLNLENAFKTHFQLQNTHTKKSKKTDSRPLYDGQIISTEGVTEKLKQLESEKQEKELEKATKKSKQVNKNWILMMLIMIEYLRYKTRI
jgi:hypothetical protein